ncbi:MAG: cytochrome c maturation protein CcmE domain-containing protein [Candidatus Cyclobacteriaceae bacterium M3_2C_046]
MKKFHLLLIISMALMVSIFFSTTQSTSQYADFSQAVRDQQQEYTVVGQLNRQKAIQYNPQINPNLVTFYMKDKSGKELKVVLNQSKPQDMERSEDIVVKGKYKNDAFYANTILLKCPSKYVEQNNFKSTS